MDFGRGLPGSIKAGIVNGLRIARGYVQKRIEPWERTTRVQQGLIYLDFLRCLEGIGEVYFNEFLVPKCGDKLLRVHAQNSHSSSDTLIKGRDVVPYYSLELKRRLSKAERDNSWDLGKTSEEDVELNEILMIGMHTFEKFVTQMRLVFRKLELIEVSLVDA